MKIFSAHTWYEKYHKHILLAETYSGIKHLPFIIKGCRFKPYDILYGNSSTSLILHKHWIDEYGNSLKLINKRPVIILNDLSVEQKSLVSTDIYYGLSLDKIYKISFFAGLDEDLEKECYYACFLGIDGHLRCYVYLYGEWEQVSPLYLGLDNLRWMSDKKDIKFFIEKKSTHLPTACVSGRAWLTCLPMSEAIRSELDRHANLIYINIFPKGENKNNEQS